MKLIKSETELLRVSTFYRTGALSTEGRSLFVEELDDYLQLLSQKKGEKFLCGDFNIHVEENHNLDKTALYDTTESYGFQQVIDRPTHREGGTLDLVFVQNEGKIIEPIKHSIHL